MTAFFFFFPLDADSVAGFSSFSAFLLFREDWEGFSALFFSLFLRLRLRADLSSLDPPSAIVDRLSPSRRRDC